MGQSGQSGQLGQRNVALSDLSEQDLGDLLRRCCGSSRWLQEVLSGAPFADPAAIERASAGAFDTLGDADWLECFEAHPRIGDLEALRERFGSGSRESQEQASAVSAPEPILRALAEANQEYENRFGLRFLVFATGKSAEEMLSILRARLSNQAGEEMRIACAEQRKITALRIRQLEG